MQINFDADDLRPLIGACLKEIQEQQAACDAQLGGNRLAYSEAEAAALLGLAQHQLRDLRLDGRIKGVKLGRSYRYSRKELARLLGEK